VARVAVDLLGGDAGPGVVADAIASILADPAAAGFESAGDPSLCLIGPDKTVAQLLRERRIDPDEHPNLRVLHAGDCVPMTASSHDTLTLLRERDDLSSIVGVEAVRDDRVDAFVSIGHTGATVGASVLGLGRITGMGRPGLAVELPSERGPVVLVDCGAAPHATAEDLVRFAAAGSAYARIIGVAEPRIGLLSIGGERGKGDHLRKQADLRLEEEFGDAYAGAVEGHDLVGEPSADVVVVDGFTGNIALKSMEGALRWSVGVMAKAYGSFEPAREVLRTSHFLSGGSLLGVEGNIVVGHGASSADEVVACIRRAALLDAGALTDRVREAVGGFAPLNSRGELAR
jgi:glycerol-3-phosphate acyltransferase PlsX